MGLPSGAAAAVDRYLHASDEAVPGLVVGLHVVGSLALGDYHPERSDIDVVVVVRDRPTNSDCALLAEVHRVVATRIDGPYLTADSLADPPGADDPVAHHVDGRFEVGPCHEVSPVTWAILANDAITVRGLSPSELGVQSDVAAVRVFSVANLRDYWVNWSKTIAAVIADTADAETMEAQLLEWGVLGAARVHCAATTGRVVSKRAGGEYARGICGREWQPLIRLALEVRDRVTEEVRVGDLRAACTFVRELADGSAV